MADRKGFEQVLGRNHEGPRTRTSGNTSGKRLLCHCLFLPKVGLMDLSQCLITLIAKPGCLLR